MTDAQSAGKEKASKHSSIGKNLKRNTFYKALELHLKCIVLGFNVIGDSMNKKN